MYQYKSAEKITLKGGITSSNAEMIKKAKEKGKN